MEFEYDHYLFRGGMLNFCSDAELSYYLSLGYVEISRGEFDHIRVAIKRAFILADQKGQQHGHQNAPQGV